MWSTPTPTLPSFPCPLQPLHSATLYQPLGPQYCRTHFHPRTLTFAIASPWSLSVNRSEKASLVHCRSRSPHPPAITQFLCFSDCGRQPAIVMGSCGWAVVAGPAPCCCPKWCLAQRGDMVLDLGRICISRAPCTAAPSCSMSSPIALFKNLFLFF